MRECAIHLSDEAGVDWSTVAVVKGSDSAHLISSLSGGRGTKLDSLSDPPTTTLPSTSSQAWALNSPSLDRITPSRNIDGVPHRSNTN
jgi:hypothetical protein